MNIPPLFLGATLLFWGWEIRALPVAVVGAVLVELPQFIRWRWDFSRTDLRRAWDLSVLLFVGAAIYSYVETDLTRGPSHFLPWLPIMFLPFILANAFSTEDRVDPSTYFWLLRRRALDADDKPVLGAFVPYWYFALCLMAASLLNVRDWRFYTGVSLLSAWLLWSVRNRQVSVVVWVLMVALVIKAGYAGHRGMNQLQALAEQAAGGLLVDLASPNMDITQRRTTVGSVGRIKRSGRIHLRLSTDPGQPAPALLRTASFSEYSLSRERPTWSIDEADFEQIFSSGETATTWVLQPTNAAVQEVQVDMIAPAGVAILPLPTGPVALHDFYTEVVETNGWSSVRTREALPLVRYRAAYTAQSTIDRPPVPSDLFVPAAELPALREVIAELDLQQQPPAEVIDRLTAFFETEFTYGRYVRRTRRGYGYGATALRDFLLESRQGHCELFATATALLLREAGIPSRYAVGYGVPAAEPGQRVHLIRARHAHAWCLAYFNDDWHAIDTTPPVWDQVEKSQASPIQPLTDWLSWARYRFMAWRYYGEQGLIPKILLGLLSPFFVWIMIRFIFRKRTRQSGDDAALAGFLDRAGTDSEFYRIEAQLQDRHLPRRAGEPLQVWLDRVDKMSAEDLRVAALREIVQLHYGHRFDPEGLSPAQRAQLREQVDEWLEQTTAAKR